MCGRYKDYFLNLNHTGYNSPLQRLLCVLERGARGVLKNRIQIETRDSYKPLNPLSPAHRPLHRGDFNVYRILNGTIFFFCFSLFSFSQQVTVTATVDSQTVSIGDWIRYSVNVKHPSSAVITFPWLKDSIGGFDIVQQDSVLKTEVNGEVERKKNFIIAKYDAGNFYVQPFVVQYREANGRIGIAQSNPIPVEIRGIEVDTAQTIKDVKPPLTVPMSAEEIAVYIGILLALAGAGYGIYYYIRKKKQIAGGIVEEKPDIPPHILALMQLDELETKRLWQSGEIKGYYTEATEIIRRYFESRYGIMALEMTTGEVMVQLEKFDLGKNVFRSIEQFLSNADLVKFAKNKPVASENEHVIVQARGIIEQTKPVAASNVVEPKVEIEYAK